MSIMTVTGPVEKEDLGIVLPHEHVFIDLRNQFAEPEDAEKRRISRQKVDISHRDVLLNDPYAIEDNLILDDFELAVEEVGFFKKAGGSTIVDCTSKGINRDPQMLRRLSLKSGLRIVAGCGYYTQDTHPREMRRWTVRELAEEMIRELTVGINGTDIRAGVIGEIGTSDPVGADEKKCLVAAATASEKTGAAIQVHTYPWGKTGLEIADILLDHGAAPGKIVICHTDVVVDMEYIIALLEKGVFVQFDNFGKEFSVVSDDKGFAGGGFASDSERISAIKRLLEIGYERQILITNDICLKCMLHRFGGYGYDYILKNIVPEMLAQGISENTIEVFLRENPGNLLQMEAG